MQLSPVRHFTSLGHHLMFPVRHLCSKIAIASSCCLLPVTGAVAHQAIDPKEFAAKQSEEILKHLGANESLLKTNRLVTELMAQIIESEMVQGMAKGTLTHEEWDAKYMRADALYIYKLGQELEKRAHKEAEHDSANVMEMAEMFLGYGKHFDRLKKYGLSANDTLVSQECDDHVALLSQGTCIKEFYISILTDMIPYVVFANYLLHSIEPSDNNPWLEYAKKYGDLNSKYAKEKLGKIIRIANEILANNEIEVHTAGKLFVEGFSFEEWFIRNAFSQGFTIVPANSQVSRRD